jgi:cell division transport system permease protein
MNYSFLRAIKFAFQDFWRNFWLSFVTITVLILALVSVNILISLRIISDRILVSVEDKVDVSVFFRPEVDRATVSDFENKLKNLPEVRETIFISKGDALADFKQKHKDNIKLLDAINEVGENPLVDTLVIKAKDLEDYNGILAFLSLEENRQIIKFQNFTDHQKIIDRVTTISDKVEKVGLAITVIFAIIAVLIVFNAIRVTIYTHKEEIAVMRLVGASDRFIRAPFLFEGVIFAFFACGIAIVLLYAGFGAVGPYLASFLEAYDFNLIQYYNDQFVLIFGIQLGAVVLLNVISSGVAIRKYLKV